MNVDLTRKLKNRSADYPALSAKFAENRRNFQGHSYYLCTNGNYSKGCERISARKIQKVCTTFGGNVFSR
jgi:hypothetical protein